MNWTVAGTANTLCFSQIAYFHETRRLRNYKISQKTQESGRMHLWQFEKIENGD